VCACDRKTERKTEREFARERTPERTRETEKERERVKEKEWGRRGGRERQREREKNEIETLNMPRMPSSRQIVLRVVLIVLYLAARPWRPTSCAPCTHTYMYTQTYNSPK